MIKTKVFLTGATGFVGSNVLKRLIADDHYGLAVSSREKSSALTSTGAEVFTGIGLEANADWSPALMGVDVVIHAAARAHLAKGDAEDDLVEYRKVNVDATLALAMQAAAAGARRFIFISSIGVNGSISSSAFKESDVPAPASPYARSKWEAEEALLQLSRMTKLEVVIIRPPLVYGAGAPGNFGKLVRLLGTGLPLPLGAIRNRRSFVAVGNLVDIIVTCIEHPAAANQVFLAGDGDDISTTQLLRGIAKAMNKSQILVPMPMSWILFLCKIVKQQALAESLLGSLQVDISKARRLLGWSPPISGEEGLQRCFTHTHKD